MMDKREKEKKKKRKKKKKPSCTHPETRWRNAGSDLKRMDPTLTVAEAGLLEGSRIMLVGTTAAAQEAFLAEDAKELRRLAARERAAQESKRRIAQLPPEPTGP
jgi:hypothetical protein